MSTYFIITSGAASYKEKTKRLVFADQLPQNELVLNGLQKDSPPPSAEEGLAITGCFPCEQGEDFIGQGSRIVRYESWEHAYVSRKGIGAVVVEVVWVSDLGAPIAHWPADGVHAM